MEKLGNITRRGTSRWYFCYYREAKLHQRRWIFQKIFILTVHVGTTVDLLLLLHLSTDSLVTGVSQHAEFSARRSPPSQRTPFPRLPRGWPRAGPRVVGWLDETCPPRCVRGVEGRLVYRRGASRSQRLRRRWAEADLRASDVERSEFPERFRRSGMKFEQGSE